MLKNIIKIISNKIYVNLLSMIHLKTEIKYPERIKTSDFEI